METKFNHRVGIIVWMYSTKYVNKLKRFGLLHYVSKKMNYAVMYVDKTEQEKTEKNLSKQHFVKKVETCYNNEYTYEFDGVLDQVTKLAEEKKKENEENEWTLFNPTTEWSQT